MKYYINAFFSRIIFVALVVNFAPVLFLSCSKEDVAWKKALRRIDKSKLFFNDYEGWKLIQEIPSAIGTEYTIEKNDNDTLKALFFESPKSEEAFVNQYRKIFPCGNLDTCHLEIHAKFDTLYYYKEKDNKKIFFVGEYSYRYIYGELDSKEIPFFDMHQDSLRRTQGNNLPKLPSID